MTSLLRESAVGQALNWASSGRILSYPEQRPGYIVPARYVKGNTSSPNATLDNFPRTNTGATLVNADGSTGLSKEGAEGSDLEKAAQLEPAEKAEVEAYPYLVEWEENDPDNPM